MKRELSWAEGHAADAEYAEYRRAMLHQALVHEQIEEDRRLSAAAAFFIFLFGVVCGAFWTFVLGWIF